MKDLLTLTQWLSPAFPVGAFAFSQGLETAIVEGRVTNCSTLKAWLCDLLEHGMFRSDLVFLSLAHQSSDIVGLNAEARAFQPSSERLEEADQLGRAFARTVRDVWDVNVPDCLYPIAVGFAAGQKSLPLPETASLYVQSGVANLVSAAVRLVPLGQTEGQAVLAELMPLCISLGARAPELSLDDLATSAFLSDIAAMRHETLSHRVFQS